MNNIAIIIPSCDKYQDVWKPLFFSINKYWPDCEFKIYLVTNFLKPKIDNVSIINAGEDISWSSNLKKALEQIPEDRVFLWIDDLLIYKKVDNERVKKIIEELFSFGGKYICLNGLPSPDKKINGYFGEVLPGSLYRVSTVFSCWEKYMLNNILLEAESAWQFEIDGSVRSDVYDGFFVTNKREIYSYNSIIKGRWRRDVIKIFKKDGFLIDTSFRKTFSYFEEILFSFKILRSKVLSLVPYKFRRKLRSFFLK